MDLHWIFACSGPGAGAVIKRNGDIVLACTALIALLAFLTFSLWTKRRLSAIWGSLLVLALYIFLSPDSGGDCGYSSAAWAETCAAISVAIASVVLIYYLIRLFSSFT